MNNLPAELPPGFDRRVLEIAMTIDPGIRAYAKDEHGRWIDHTAQLLADPETVAILDWLDLHDEPCDECRDSWINVDDDG